MPKTWEQLTEPEKIEDLRRDVVRLFDILTHLRNDVARVWGAAQENQTKLFEVAKAVEELENRLPEANPNQPDA